MTRGSVDWNQVADHLAVVANAEPAIPAAGHPEGWQLNAGQRMSLLAIGERLPNNGVVIADEVGMGKTRIAVAVARSVLACGGRVAIVVPPGLGFQWRDELRDGGLEAPSILRSFWQYLSAWEPECIDDRKPWFKEPVVLISHAFTTWRLGTSSQPWRWALLPEVYAQWRKRRDGRLPRNFRSNDKLGDAWVQRAAMDIVDSAHAASSARPRLQKLLDGLVEQTPWPGALEAGEYAANERLRPWLERAVGLGLGLFDLIIIDEAHKSRGSESGLSRLVEGVLQTTDRTRRVAMTATPVELDASQWQGTLGRIGVDRNDIADLVKGFAETVRRVRCSPSNPDVREVYSATARTFETALTPYLIRRDKREDPAVRAFNDYSGLPIHAYRQELEILVDPATLSGPWKETVCAAEALSLVTRHADDPIGKRLRLTLGSGHGIAALIVAPDEAPDGQQEQEDGIEAETHEAAEGTTGDRDKRLERAAWWRDVITRTAHASDDALLNHPVLLSAIDAIETAHRQGEKVLVFGRFTRPLQALVNLLNARELWRYLEQGRPWPQSKVPDEEWPAVQSAHRQLGLAGPLDRSELDARLEQQYKALERLRERFRTDLLDNIERGMEIQPVHMRAAALFSAFKTSVEQTASTPNRAHPLVLVSRALQELLPPASEAPPPERLAEAFTEFVDALCERDEGDDDGDGDLDPTEADALWAVLVQRMDDEYNRTQGGFARLMYGGTRPDTRRLLQLAFNRQQSFPRVLVAQSMVGREGLNLHRACRIVLLLHPEWNPGVVEQQIGRVDRLGSHWERLCTEAIAKGCAPHELPRIEIRPVIFKGTYDEKNWEVLRERWDDLRAQLHGVIIPHREAYPGMQELVDEINSMAPSFSPAPLRS
ncbi:helicase-related protein [Thiohalocapsa marina]|jgi:hypothetical protein|uniref:helicase-related protein n=1 Tax=Thiohalocapsa marina TaxID=424902 RepID=UPI0036DA283F